MKSFSNAKNSDLEFFIKFHARPFAAQNVGAMADLHERFAVALKRREVIIRKNIHTFRIIDEYSFIA
jgi:hypothetical protein